MLHYNNPVHYLPHLILNKESVKRKWESDEEERRSICSSPEQLVPLKKIKVSEPLTVSNSDPLPFTRMMKMMASKYNNPESTTSNSPTITHNPLLSLLSPMSNPYSKLMADLVKMSQSQPLDLTSNRLPEVDEDEVDVVSTEEAKVESMEQWNCHKVRDFVERIEGCEDYAGGFLAERIDGATFSALTLGHLTSFLGIKLGHALLILKKREDYHKR